MRSTVAPCVGLLVTIPCLVAGVLIGPRAHHADRAASVLIDGAQFAGATDPSTDRDSSSISDSNTDGPADLYGNPVTNAVADYRLDSAGSLYEEHSPQTEVPKLASPKS